MSRDDTDAPAQLKRDFESYLNGERPSPLELASAPLLESWRATVMQFKREGGPLPMVHVLLSPGIRSTLMPGRFAPHN
jgi:hypothetical protein